MWVEQGWSPPTWPQEKFTHGSSVGSEEPRFACKGPKEEQASGKRPHRGLEVSTAAHSSRGQSGLAYECVQQMNGTAGEPVKEHT